MCVTVDIKDALKQLGHLTKQLTGKQLATGISRGINRALMEGRTEARKAVKELYNIPQKNLSGINIKKSFPTTLTGYIYASSKPIPMDAFAPKFETASASISVSKKGQQKIRDRKRKSANLNKGVSIEVHRGKREVVPFAFMIKGAKPRVFARGQYRSGAFGFQRRHKRENSTGNDTPIKPLLSVTVFAAVINPGSTGKIKNRLQSVFPKHLIHELQHLIKGLPK